jgi:uncharacterized protein DUF922
VHVHARRSRTARHADRDRAGASDVASLTARAASATDLATLFRIADAGSRRRLAGEIQASHGNATLVSLLGSATRVHGLPAHVHAGSASDVLTELADDLGTGGGEVEPDADDPTAKPAPTTSATTITVTDTTFSVSGEFAVMAADLAARSEAGSVTSQVSDIYLEPTKGPVTLANITITETRSLPTWVDRGTPKPEQVAEWDRFRAAIGIHEQGHIDIDTKAFTNLHTKAIGVPQDKANERIDAVVAAAEVANTEYDTKTDHGRKAGTSIDTNVGAGITKVP